MYIYMYVCMYVYIKDSNVPAYGQTNNVVT